MHRVFLLAFVASIAAAASIGSLNTPTYRPGNEYTYNYESQVLSGIRTVSRQLSGIKIHAIVKLQIQRNNIAALKMENIKVFQVNHELPHGISGHLLTDEHLTLLDEEILEHLTVELVKPIKFRYIEGEVKDVETMRHDKLWSINIKKGIVSGLQLKLNPKSSSVKNYEGEEFWSLSPRSSRLFDPSSNWQTGISKSSPMFEGAYNVIESDVNGDCETKYSVETKSSTDYSKVSEKIVTKVKNFDTCLNKHTVEMGLFAGLPHFNSEKHLIEPSSEAEYEISGDRHNFVIKKMLLTAKYFFRPYGQESGHVSTHIIQKMVLRGSDSIRTSFLAGPFQKEKKGLHMEIPHSSFTNEIPVPDVIDLPYREIVERKLEELIRMIESQVEEETPMKLMQLNIILRDMPYKALLEITKFYVTKVGHVNQGTDEYKKREIILDILPLLPSPHVAKILSELIKEERISEVRASLSINALALTIRPTPEVVKTLLNLYKDLESRRPNEKLPFLKRSVLLGLGSVINKMTNLMKKQNKPHPEVLSTIETVTSELERMLSQTSDDKKKLLVIKSMGNMGVKNVIPILRHIVENKQTSEHLRIKAICSLRKLSKHFDKTVHPILLSIYLNEEEPSIVRIAAFKVIKEGKPSFTTLQLITHKLKEEQSHQVKTFVYSSLVNLATHKTQIKEIEELVKNARKVLKTIRPIPVGLKDSKSIMIESHLKPLDIDSLLSMDLIKSKLHGVPEKMITALRVNILGNLVKVGEIGIGSKGIEDIVRRLVGPYGTLEKLFKGQVNFFDLLKPLASPEMGYARESFTEIINKKSFEVRNEELKGFAYLSILGQELQFIDLESEDVEEVASIFLTYLIGMVEKLNSGINLDLIKVVSMTSNSLVIPTPIGLPLSLNMSFAGLIKLKGSIKVINMPTVSQLMRGDVNSLRNIEIESTGIPSFNSELFTYMGVDMRFLRSGVGIKGRLVASTTYNGKLIVNMDEYKFTAKYEIPSGVSNTLRAELVPVTFIYLLPVGSAEQMPFIYSIKEINTNEILVTVPLETSFEHYGIRTIFQGQVVKCINTWCPYLPFNGIHLFHLQLTTIEPITEELYVKISQFSKDHQFGKMTFDREMEEGHEYTREHSNAWRNDDDELPHGISFRGNDEFEPIETETSIQTPRQLQAIFECGSKRGKHFRSQLVWIHGEHVFQHQINLQSIVYGLDGTPTFKSEINTIVDLPRGFEIWKPKTLAALNGKTLVKTTVSYICKTFGENTFTIKLTGLDTPTWTSELEKVVDLLPVTYPVIPLAYRFAINYHISQITPHLRRTLSLLGDLVKSNHFWSLFLHSGDFELLSGKGSFLMQYVPRMEKLCVIVKKEGHNSYAITLPVINKLMSGFMLPSLTDSHPILSFGNSSSRLGEWYHSRPGGLEHRGYSNVEEEEEEYGLLNYDEEETYGSYYGNMESFLIPRTSPSLFGKCKVNSDRLTTFDGVPLLLPERPSGSCNVILAHDCSERKLFSISGSLKEGRWWGVKILVPELELQFIPVVESRTGSGLYQVRSNGNNVEVTTRRNTEIYNPERTLLIATIKKLEDGLIVKLHELGLKLKLKDGEYVSLSLSPLSMLQGRICGLCGDFNYDQGEELTELSSGRTLKTKSSFVLDKVLPSATCNMGEYETMLLSRYESECQKTKTLKINRLIEGVEKECFSTRPVPTCAHGCENLETTSTVVPFTCLNVHDPRVEGLNEKLHRERVVPELSSMPVNYQQTMEVSNKCTCQH